MFAMGSILASLLMGGLLAVGKALVPDNEMTTSLLLAILLASVTARMIGRQIPLPSSRWVVPREWTRFPRPIHAFAFGAALGTGVATRIPSVTILLMIAMCLLAGSSVNPVLVLLAFGVSRALPMLIASNRLAHSGQGIAAEVTRLRRAAPSVAGLAVVVTSGIAGMLLSTLGDVGDVLWSVLDIAAPG
jgi:hypothetical protein